MKKTIIRGLNKRTLKTYNSIIPIRKGDIVHFKGRDCEAFYVFWDLEKELLNVTIRELT